ncbi:MAG: hypothetical protein HZC28_16195 [Spirochaetes bacterium]|nr:hypothetical protein [Spirochaetota bacterium]
MRARSIGMYGAAVLMFMMSAAVAEPAGMARINLSAKGKVNLTPGTASPGAKIANITWGSEIERKQSLIAEVTLADGWNAFSVSFTPDADGTVQLDLAGQDKNGEDKKKIALYTFYDDITVSGAELKNGDFESFSDKKPDGWWFWAADANRPGRIVYAANAHGGGCFAAAWAQGTVVQGVAVKAGQEITVRGFAYPAGEIDVKSMKANPPAGVRKLPVNAKLFFFDLAQSANMGFADDTAGDGKGGWSDQGAANDFREFDVKKNVFGDVPFKIIDPAANGGKAVLSFRHDTALPGGITSAVIDAPADTAGRYLYVLHTACWNGAKQNESIGIITVAGKDGKEIKLDVQSKRDVADWWNPVRLPNGVVVVAKANQSALVGIYFSRYDLGAVTDVKRITLSGTGKALWIVAGITMSDGDYPLPEMKKLEIVEGDEWKALTETNLAVKAGTALDFSGWIDRAPAGSKGRVIARPDGTLAFAAEPGKTVRFFVYSGVPTKESDDVEQLAEAIYRQGYNMVRLHFLDQYLSGQTVNTWGKTLSREAQDAFDARLDAGETTYLPERMERIDRFVAALKKRGIYLYIDAMTSWAGLYPANCWYDNNGVPSLKPRMFYDDRIRKHYHHAVRMLFNHTNAYTGTTLAADPQVVMVLGFNEITTDVESYKKFSTAVQTGLLPKWRAFLASKFSDVAAFRKAWTGSESVRRIDEAPFFAPGDMWHSARKLLVAEFVNQIEEETSGFMEKEIRATGYSGLYTMYDWLYALRLYLSRAKGGVVSMHGYFAHPSEVGGKPSVAQTSSLAEAVNWWRGIAASRIAGMPFAVPEYGQVFWNKYRYEEGLSVGAYGSLQDMSLLCAHADPVSLTPVVDGPFRVGADPIARASQVVTGMLFMGNAVAAAAHRVDIPLSRELALGRAENAISGDQSRIGLLTGFAVAVEGRTPGVKPSMLLPLGDGAKTVDAAFFSTIVDSESGTFSGALAQLRKQGILPEKNRTDADKKIYECETGEILLESMTKRLRVKTPVAAGVCADRWESSVKAGALTVESSSVPASITVASRDGKPVTKSGRLLLVIATDARNSGTKYDDEEGIVETAKGKLPVLLRVGTFTVKVERDAGSPKLRAWALSLDGTRRDELSVQHADGAVTMTIDTGALKAGPSLFMEIAER